MPRYHTSLGLPPTLRLPVGLFKVRPSRHALDQFIDGLPSS